MEESYFYFDAFNGDSDLVNFLCNRLLAILVLSLFVGVAGGSFTVGIAYCARWFKKSAKAWQWEYSVQAIPARLLPNSLPPLL